MFSRLNTRAAPVSAKAGAGKSTGTGREAGVYAMAKGRKMLLASLAVVAVLALAGCTSGSYPVDIFYEQHYQQSYKSHEPPRLLGVEGAVAFFPAPPNTVDDSDAYLYEINCQMCHGNDGRESGAVLQRMVMSPATGGYGYQYSIADPDTGQPRPPDLTVLEPAVIDGYLRSSVRPFGPNSVMPPFGKLLSESDREAIIRYVGTLP